MNTKKILITILFLSVVGAVQAQDQTRCSA